MKLSIKDLFSKCYQICRTLWIWSYLLNKSSPVHTRRLYDVADVETTCVYWVKGKLNNLYSGKTTFAQTEKISFGTWKHQLAILINCNCYKVFKVFDVTGPYTCAIQNCLEVGVVVCTCNPATLEAEFRNGVGSIPAGGNSPSIGGWIK